jgi:hypothetical protein
MVTTSSPQSDTNPIGVVTEKTVFWAETIVRWTRGTAADIRVEPTAERGAVLAQIHRGDMIQVRTDIKRDEWVPCRAGHVTGWLNTQEVKLIRTGMSPTKEVIYVQSPPIAENTRNGNGGEAQNQHKSNLIQRLIKFFT